MRLTRLEMLGFKSFMNKGDLRFEEDVTAILGPNGCGKSNIVDAIRWVLGEQSAKLLRGSKMENVIFQGTRRRPPMGFAEVTLTFSGASETLPVDWDEFSIKRRVNRGGGSEYFLNGKPHRLRDIHDLLSGSGLGNHAYAIIEQDMVKSILSDNGEKRRVLFEEASGILKYKLRRKESLSRMKSVEEDLLRIDDILEELGKQVRSLKYQVGRARSHQRLQEELRSVEIHGSSQELHGMWKRDRTLSRSQDNLNIESSEESGKLSGLEEEISRIELSLLDRENRYRKEREDWDQESAKLRKREEEIVILEEKIRSENRRAEDLSQERKIARDSMERNETAGSEIRQESETLEAELKEAGEKLAESRDQLKVLDEEYRTSRDRLLREKQTRLNFAQSRAEAGGEVQRLEERLRQLSEDLASLSGEENELGRQEKELRNQATEARSHLEESDREREKLETLREKKTGQKEEGEKELKQAQELLRSLKSEEKELQSRRDLLMRLHKEREGMPEGSRRLLKEENSAREIRGTLSDLLQIDPGDREIFELALSSSLDALVLDHQEKALPWLDSLRREDGGRALILETRGEAREGKSIEGLRPLLDLARPEESLRPTLSRLLWNTYLAADTDSALKASRFHPDIRVLTREGLLVDSRGILSGGSKPSAASALAREEEIESLGRQIGDIGPRKQSAESRQGELERSITSLSDEIRSLGEQIREAREIVSRHELEKTRLETRLHRLGEELQGVKEEHRLRKGSEGTMKDALQQAEMDLRDFHGKETPGEENLEELESRVQDLESLRDRSQAELSDLRLEHTRIAGEGEKLRLREQSREREEDQLGERIRRSEEGIRESGDRAQEALARKEELSQGLSERQDEIEKLRSGSDQRLEEINSFREAQREKQETAKTLRDARHQKEQTAHELEIERSTLKVRMETLCETILDKYGIDLDPSRGPSLDEETPEAPEGKTLHEHVEELKEKIRRLGNVNLLALDEFEEANERYQFLIKQKEDLEEARKGLMETIRKINKEARERFDETFSIVRKNFIEIFTAVFDGGEADLAYSTDEDPLDAEIVITARPREKSIADISQLSSGEKTLTALSILFAIYLSKPSPFCVFDEVDAPLDDANIVRFLRLIHQFSKDTQFLLITHNKKTMEAAKHLFGVTMEESGVSRIVSVAFDELPEDLDREPLIAGKGA
ncbi:MAG: chromosome segregation protein SMC [Candidatus Krumholzibacteria bacterium]|nr:chromosome segregation protein SMC [Candidatus Krumholzibacteria bacterium]